MDHSRVPFDAPDDAVMAGPAEVREMKDWVDAVFSVGPVSDPGDFPAGLLSAGPVPPFSFVYGGTPSGGFLKTWTRSVETVDRTDHLEYRVEWTEPGPGLCVTAVVRVFKRYPAADWVLHFENRGTRDTPLIEDVRALDTFLATEKKDPVVVHRIAGDSCDRGSFAPFESEVRSWGSDTRLCMAPLDGHGRSSNGTFPFFNVEYRGRGVIAAIGWSGQWAASLDRDAEGPTRFRAGMEGTRLVLHPGERIRSPRILLMAWHGDRLAAHNRFRRLMLFHYMPRHNGLPVLLPLALECFCRYSSTRPEWATEAGQIAAVRFAHAAGFDALWLDAAWFEGGFPDGVGNWHPKPEEFPRGLKPVGDACRMFGLRFIVWFEPERVAPGTRIAREHPEFVFPGEKSGLFRLDDPSARRWLTDLLSQRIDEFGLDIYRNDFNIDPLPFWRANDAPDRRGMTEIRYVEGLYAMWDELLARHPGLIIDNCASGGRRIDLETCMRSVPLSRSDSGCVAGHADWDQTQSCGLNLYIPLHAAISWASSSYEFRSSATAGAAFEWAFLEEDFPLEQARAALSEIKETRKYWYGDFYPLTSCPTTPDAWVAWQLHRPDLAEGIIQIFRRADSVYETARLHPRGLDPDAIYAVRNRDTGEVSDIAGRDLMERGLRLEIPERPRAVLLFYRRAGREDGGGRRPCGEGVEELNQGGQRPGS